MLRLVLIFTLANVVFGGVTEVRSSFPHQDQRIVGGRDVDIRDFPYQLSVEENGKHKCGASLIAPNAAVTTARCIDRVSPSSLRVRAGSSILEQGGTLVNVVAIKVHPDYDGLIADCDVAVLTLASDLNAGPGILPVKLVAENHEVPVGSVCLASGWGSSATGGSLSKQLKAANVPVVSEQDCQEAYAPDYPVTENMLCAGHLDGGDDICDGDSGGPLICNGFLSGIVSWSLGCGHANEPSVYAKVAKLTDFIREAAGIN